MIYNYRHLRRDVKSLLLAAAAWMVLGASSADGQTLQLFNAREEVSTSSSNGNGDDGKEPVLVEVLASGNVKDVLSTESDDAAFATGSLGVSFTRAKTNWTALVNIAATEDTLTGAFASSMINPATGDFSGLLDYQHLDPLKIPSSTLHVYGSVSQAVWKSAEEGSQRVVTLGFGALAGYDIIRNIEFEGRSYALRVEGGLALRSILGDGASGDNADFRLSTVGTDVKHFPGLEAGMILKVGGVTAGLQFYYIMDVSDKDVVGLTGGQLTGGISINTTLFRIPGMEGGNDE